VNLASSDLSLVLEPIIALASISLGIYTVFWAFKIRQILFVKVYRDQALGIGMITLLVVTVLTVFDLVEISYPFLAGGAPFFLWGVSFVLFYWINASVMSGRLTDPLFRDTAGWKKLRFVILGLMVFGVISSVGLILYNAVMFERGHSVAAALWLFSPLFEAGGTGAVVLPIVARRSSDNSLREHLQWFGLMGIVLLIVLPIGIVSDSLKLDSVANNLVLNSLLFVMTYFLYRSAKSLVPRNHLPTQIASGLERPGASSGKKLS
jgi:hypothetical protein